jgi:hypothetical protein
MQNRTERKCDGSQFATSELSECAGDNIAAEEQENSEGVIGRICPLIAEPGRWGTCVEGAARNGTHFVRLSLCSRTGLRHISSDLEIFKRKLPT